MPHPKNESLAILERRRLVAARSVRSEPPYRIAQAFELDKSTTGARTTTNTLGR